MTKDTKEGLISCAGIVAVISAVSTIPLLLIAALVKYIFF